MRIGIITDSNSGITQSQAEELGIYVVPMPFMIDGQTYFEDINLTQEQFYEKLKAGADISTSQPSPESVTGLWDRLLEEYDQLVHIPMSSGLSGSCQTAMMLAQDYEGKVFVVNNHRISVTQRQSALDAKMLADEGKTGEEIQKILYDSRYDSSIYITVDTLKYLKKGRTDHSDGRSLRHSSADQAGADHTGGEAGCLCQGPHHEAGEKYYADGLKKGSGGAVPRRRVPQDLSGDRPHGE